MKHLLSMLSLSTEEITDILNLADQLKYENKNGIVTVRGKGLRGLNAPSCVLDCGNSGTTTRLISGILAPQHFDVTLTGDDSIRKPKQHPDILRE